MIAVHVLLTNDDGIWARGLRFALSHLSRLEWARISVVAPERERSAIGHAITLHKPLHVTEVEIGGKQAWSVNGTPADCTKLAVLALLKDKPDLVISGINAGYNVGSDILYSGTVSAAIEGVLLGIPSLAASVSGSGGERELDRAGSFLCRLVEALRDQRLDPGTLLNVNVPPGEEEEPVKMTRLGASRYRDVFHKRTDPRGRTYYWLAGRCEADHAAGTDVWTVDRGSISITPLHFDLTHHTYLEHPPPWPDLRG